jgi:hypothetical protein
MKQCRECGTLSPDDTIFCYICGTKFPELPEEIRRAQLNAAREKLIIVLQQLVELSKKV